MPVTVIVGGQYGSEGKGKLTSYLSIKDDVDYVVRCGGPNAGHSFTLQDKQYLLRQLPSGLINPNTQLRLAAGAVIDKEILFAEMEQYGIDRSRVRIAGNAIVLTEEDKKVEEERRLRHQIGSTLSGTGGATWRKIKRGSEDWLAKNDPELKDLCVDVSLELNKAYDLGASIIIEGAQGLGLSLHHSFYYPYTTSRDTSASAFLSEVGLSPRCVDEIIVVFRTFPIRVPGQSGYMMEEISWEDVQRESGYPHEVKEYATVTKQLRRVARFDWELAQNAVAINRPTQIAVHGLDYIDYKCFGSTSINNLSFKCRQFVSDVEKILKTPATLIFTGPDNMHLIDLRGITSKTIKSTKY